MLKSQLFSTSIVLLTSYVITSKDHTELFSLFVSFTRLNKIQNAFKTWKLLLYSNAWWLVFEKRMGNRAWLYESR